MFSFKVAYRFLISNKGQMVLITLGIAIGVSVQVFIGSLITGLQSNLIETTVGRSPHITITEQRKGDPITDWQNQVEANDSSIRIISPVLDVNGFLVTDQSYPIVMRGFDLEKANSIYRFDQQLIEGSMPIRDNEVLLGTNLVEELNVKIGDTLLMQSPKGKQVDVTLVGIYDLKVAAINNSWVVTTLPTTQVFGNLKDSITSFELQVTDVFKADEVAKTIKTDLVVTNWKETNAQLLSGLSGQSISSLMIQVFVLVSVVLGIASVLIISVVQKRKQIGILKAMGLKKRQASTIFLAQGLILGVLGATLGILFGLGLLWSFTTFAVNPDGTAVVPISLNTMSLLYSWIIAVVAALLASIIPSLSSSKLSPIEVIKNG